MGSRYGTLPEPETQFLMALNLCEDFFSAACVPIHGTQLSHAVELLTPLLSHTSLWFWFLDRHHTRIQPLRSQLQDLLDSSAPECSCCLQQQETCPTFCDPIEYAHLLLTLLSS